MESIYKRSVSTCIARAMRLDIIIYFITEIQLYY